MKSKPIKGVMLLKSDWSKKVHLYYDSLPLSTTINRGLIIQKKSPRTLTRSKRKLVDPTPQFLYKAQAFKSSSSRFKIKTAIFKNKLKIP